LTFVGFGCNIARRFGFQANKSDKEEAMKRFLWALPVLLVVCSANVLADSITMGLAPNEGGGDNFGLISVSPGLLINVGGGTPFDFFNNLGYAPGSDFGGESPVFFSDGIAQIGNTLYDLGFEGQGTLFITNFTLPSNGKDFTIQVTADFSASAFLFINGQFQQLGIGGSAPGTMKFNWDPASGLYFGNPVVFTTVPEPGTLGLMVAGLISTLVAARRSRRV